MSEVSALYIRLAELCNHDICNMLSDVLCSEPLLHVGCYQRKAYDKLKLWMLKFEEKSVGVCQPAGIGG